MNKKEWSNPEVSTLNVENTLGGGINPADPDNTYIDPNDGLLYTTYNPLES